LELDCSEKLSFNKGLGLFLLALSPRSGVAPTAASGDRAALLRALWYVHSFGFNK